MIVDYSNFGPLSLKFLIKFLSSLTFHIYKKDGMGYSDASQVAAGC